MGINLSVPRGAVDLQLKPRITVIGVGGAGGNAVNNMIAKKLEGVDFIVANTDAQAMAQSRTERRIQLGVHTTEGLGAGARPEVGRAAAEETLEQLQAELAGSHMAFITAGMGGGTGTGAAPVIARAAREMGILTVGVVTKPFHFEGITRMRLAEAGMEELARYVDTLIIIPNQNLFRVANERTTFAQAFNMADDVLYAGVRGVTDLIMMPGLINLDFADIRTVMGEMGKAMMGTGEAEGDKRALDAAEAAISNPLLDDTSMKGARGVLINITGGPDMTLYEVDEAANRIRDEVDPDANIIFGSTFDERLEGRVRVSVVATGIESEPAVQARPTAAAAPAAPTSVLDMNAVREQRQAAPPLYTRAAPETARAASPAPMGQATAEAPRAESAPAAPAAEPATLQNLDTVDLERPAFERMGAQATGDRATAERAAAPYGRPPGRADAFIPGPAMEARDIGNRNGGGMRPMSAPPAPRAAVAPTAAPAVARQPEPQPVAPAAPPAPALQPVVNNAEPPRRPQTLLEKVAGIGRIRRSAEPPKAESRDLPARPQVADQPSLKVEADDRPVNSMDEDLDIPAFLRRQAN